MYNMESDNALENNGYTTIVGALTILVNKLMRICSFDER